MIHFDWASLSGDEFEELNKEFMRRKNFINVERMSGPGSGDRGRDLLAEENLLSETGGAILTRILVQCKNYAGSRRTISSTNIEGWSNRARTLGCNRLLVITSHDLSSPAKNTVHEISNSPEWGINVQFWNVFTLTRLLLEYPDVKRLFSVSALESPSYYIGILNGYVTNPSIEEQCPYVFTRVTAQDWRGLFETENFSIKMITTSEIDNHFDAIINPFGEIYPEEDPILKKTYNDIKDYILNGGVFLNCGGFPFFYYWDCNQGERYNTSEPSLRIFNPSTGRIEGLYTFNDTMFTRDFRVNLNPGNPREIRITQREADITYEGNLSSLGYDRINEFRSVIRQTGDHIIPLSRSEDNNLFPLSAIRLGYGYFLQAGVDQYEREANITARVLINWIQRAGGLLE